MTYSPLDLADLGIVGVTAFIAYHYFTLMLSPDNAFFVTFVVAYILVVCISLGRRE